MSNLKIPLIVILGPTCSGKTDLSIEVAKKFNCEIISADSMQIYKGMDIATAKPSLEQLKKVKHHLIDFLDYNQNFSVSEYVKLARKCISDIRAEGKLPLLVGGTGLYIHSLIDDYNFEDSSTDDALREMLWNQVNTQGKESIYNHLKELDPETAKEVHPNNIKRVIRAIEVYTLTGLSLSEYRLKNKPQTSIYNPCIIGLNYNNRELLYQRINQRVDEMVKKGLIDEAREFFFTSNNNTSYQVIGYKEFKDYFLGKSDIVCTLEKIKQETRRYAKRQITWFKKDQRINWLYIDEYIKKDFILKKIGKIIEKFMYI